MTILRTGHTAPEHSVAVKRRLPKRPMSIAKMIERLESALANMERSSCTFWACEGPSRPRHMITCTRCWAVRDIQLVLRHLRALKSKEDGDPA